MNDLILSTLNEDSLIIYIADNIKEVNEIETIDIYYKKIFDYAIYYINDIEYDEDLKYKFDNILKCYEGFLRLHGNMKYCDEYDVSLFDYSYTFSDAIKMLRDVIKINSKDKSAYYLLGVCFESKNQLPNAIENYKISLSLSKEIWTYYWLARCLYKSNIFDEALSCLDEILNYIDNENIDKKYLDVYEFKNLILQKQNKYDEVILNCFDAKKHFELSKTLLDDAKFSSITLLDKGTTNCKKYYIDEDYDNLLITLLDCFYVYYALGINDLDFRNYLHYVKISYESHISNEPFSGLLEYKDCINYIREILFNKGDYKSLFSIQLKINTLNTFARFPGYIDLTYLISKLSMDVKGDKSSFNINNFYDDNISISSSLNCPIISTHIEDRIINLIDVIDECIKIEPENKHLFLFEKANLLQKSKLYNDSLDCYSIIIEDYINKSKEVKVDNEYANIAFKSLNEKLKVLNIIHESDSSEIDIYLNELCNIYDEHIQKILKDTGIKYEKMYFNALNYCDKIINCLDSKVDLQEIWKFKKSEVFLNYIKTHISIIDCEANFIYGADNEGIIIRHFNFDDEGLKLYDELINLNPKNPMFYYYKGTRLTHIIKFQKKRNYGVDLSHFAMNKSKNKNAKNLTTERLKSAIYYINNKNAYDELLSLYIKAYQLDNTNKLFIDAIINLLERLVRYNNYIKSNRDKINKYIKL